MKKFLFYSTLLVFLFGCNKIEQSNIEQKNSEETLLKETNQENINTGDLQQKYDEVVQLFRTQKYKEAFDLAVKYNQNGEFDELWKFASALRHKQESGFITAASVDQYEKLLSDIPDSYNGVLAKEIKLEKESIYIYYQKAKKHVMESFVSSIKNKKYDEVFFTASNEDFKNDLDLKALYNYANALTYLPNDVYRASTYLEKIPVNYHAEFANDIERLKEKYDIDTRIENSASQVHSKPYPVLGMTKEEVRNSSWGEPKDINRTITENNVHEQWVYSLERYIYFDNDIVTAIQD